MGVSGVRSRSDDEGDRARACEKKMRRDKACEPSHCARSEFGEGAGIGLAKTGCPEACKEPVAGLGVLGRLGGAVYGNLRRSAVVQEIAQAG